jgi:hypothetical protein
MSFLNNVTKVNSTGIGIRVVIAGVEKIGKTTFGCSAPKPLLIPLEHGYAAMIGVEKTPEMSSYKDVVALLDEIISACKLKRFTYKSLVFDSTTALERLIHEAVISLDPSYKKGNKDGLSMETSHGGYGKAYPIANEMFGTILAKCDELCNHGGINIIMTCHVFASKVIDPAFGEYDSWDLLLHSPKNNKNYGKREMITQWADIVGFLHEPMFISKTKDSELAMGISSNKGRVLGIERVPAYVAGNRYGIKGEISIGQEQSWNYLAHAIYTAKGLDVYNRG